MLLNVIEVVLEIILVLANATILMINIHKVCMNLIERTEKSLSEK